MPDTPDILAAIATVRAAGIAQAYEAQHTESISMTDDQVKHMVNRFLRWRLPDHFMPDCGITFKKEFNEHTGFPSEHKPVGTNLLSATQAEEMIRHLIEGLPSAEPLIGRGE